MPAACLEGVTPTAKVGDPGGTGPQASVLAFGCGAVGGLMNRATPDQERAVARALELGIN